METLKNYSVILRDDYDQSFCTEGVNVTKLWKTPVSYAARQDTLDIDFSPVLSQDCNKCFSYLQLQAPEVLLGTKTLEITNWDWVTGVVRMYDDEIEEFGDLIFFRRGKRPGMTFFRCFRNLEAVKLVSTRDPQIFDRLRLTTLSSEERPAELAHMRKWFENNEQQFAKGVPTITIEDYMRRSGT